MANSKTFTTKEVARLCHVSDATVKRWEDAGLLNSERTNGGHRRFRPEEIARFQREQGLGQKLAHGDESVFAASNRCAELKAKSDYTFFDAILAGCEEVAADVLINTHLQKKELEKIFDDVMCPPIRQIGKLWFEGELTIAQEHLATRTAQNALYKFRSVLPVPEPRGSLAMCCAFEGEFHELPIHLAQMTFENEGWEVLNFGANTPLFCLVEEIQKHAPEAICISATIMNDMERLSRDYAEFRKQIKEIPIILGGGVFLDECMQKRFPAELYPKSFTQLADYVRGLSENDD